MSSLSLACLCFRSPADSETTRGNPPKLSVPFGNMAWLGQPPSTAAWQLILSVLSLLPLISGPPSGPLVWAAPPPAHRVERPWWKGHVSRACNSWGPSPYPALVPDTKGEWSLQPDAMSGRACPLSELHSQQTLGPHRPQEEPGVGCSPFGVSGEGPGKPGAWLGAIQVENCCLVRTPCQAMREACA